MNKLQITIIDLIKEIDQICRKYDITYYASGGTVIGAFRHGGFIPWDDDADLYMTRDNYHKFLEAFHKEKPKGRSYGTLEEDINYPGTITHYKNDENTSFITRYHTLGGVDAGVVVDIFILDPVSDDPKHWEEHIGKLKIYADLNLPYYGYANCGNTEYMPEYFKYAKKVEKYGKAQVNKELEEELFTYPEEKATHYILRWGTLPHVFSKEMFGEPVYVDYEGFPIPMPTKWYDYLVQLYGYNWNEIPSNVASEGHTAVISTEHRYTNYLIDTERFIDKDKALHMYFKRKAILIEREILRRPFIERFLTLKGEYVLKSQHDYLSLHHIDINKLYEDKKYSEIIKHYNIYLTGQFNPYYIGKMSHNYFYRLKNPIFIPLSENELEILMYSLFYQSDFNKLNKLLLMTEINKKDFQFLKDIKSLLNVVHEIMSLYYEKRYQEALNLLSAEENKFVFTIERMERIYYSCLLYCQVSLSEEQIAYIQANTVNHHSDWLKIYGDYLNSIHDENAKDYYQKCAQLTNDGFILNELKKMYGIEKDYSQTSSNAMSCDQYHERQLELLDEFVDILNQNNIDYYLVGDTLISAYLTHTLSAKYVPIEIAIKPEDAKKVMSLFKNNEKFFTPLENPGIVTHGFNYKSLEHYCTILTSNGKIEKKEMYVRIHILRKNSSNVLERKILNALNLLNRVNSSQHISSKYKFIAKIFFTIFPRKSIRKIIFNKYLETSLNNKDNKYRINKKAYDVNCFDDYTMMSVYSRQYKVPKQVEEIMSNDLKRVLLKEKMYDESMFILYDESYTLDEIQNIFKSLENETDMIHDYMKALRLNGKLRPYNKQAKYNWDILLRAEDRFNLYLKYKDKKDLILSLYKQGNFNELWNVLNEYDNYVKIYLAKGMGLCFDKDILSIYLTMLRKKGDDKMADKLEHLVPKVHLEEIEVLDI